MIDVNSFHHQAIHRLGDGLHVAGRSDDGVVEAIEDPARDCVVGVQWHAECLVDDPTHRRLFAALVDAARLRDRMIPGAWRRSRRSLRQPPNASVPASTTDVPPSTVSTAPVTYAASRESSQTTAAAASSDVAGRRAGTCLVISA
jgi:hypothetical protein